MAEFFPSFLDNLVITHSNVQLTYPPNVSRSWSPREMRVRAEERMAKSVGDRDQENEVLDWCKKNHITTFRKLPKLDSTILVSKTNIFGISVVLMLVFSKKVLTVCSPSCDLSDRRNKKSQVLHIHVGISYIILITFQML